MHATRNRRFGVAATLAAVSSLLLAAHYIVEAAHLGEYSASGGYVVATVLFAAVRLVAAPGLLLIAGAFGPELDWRRLRRGATIVVSTYIASFAATVIQLIPVLDLTHNKDYHGIFVAAAVSALFVALGACVVASGFTDARQGSARASRLWIGAILVTAGYVATTASQLYQQSFYSAEGAAHKFTIAALVMAIGSLGIALAALVFTVRGRRPLLGREAGLAAAAAIAAAGSFCIAGGEAVFAVAYSSKGAPTWEATELWLSFASRVVFVAAVTALALGARAASQPA